MNWGAGYGTSNAYAAHLHYEVFVNGKRVDPMGGNPDEPIDPQTYLKSEEVIQKEKTYIARESATTVVVIGQKEELK